MRHSHCHATMMRLRRSRARPARAGAGWYRQMIVHPTLMLRPSIAAEMRQPLLQQLRVFRVRWQQQPARQVVDHSAFITDNKEKLPELHSLGPIDQEGQHCMGCGAAHWFEESTKADQKRGRKAGNRPVTFSRCCKSNTIRLPPISDPFPEEIKALFTGEGNTFHDTSVTPALRNTFCKYTRTINNNLALACVTNPNQDKNINQSLPAYRAPWVYRIHRQMYRRIGPAQARNEAVAAKYSELYFRDPAELLESYRQAFEGNQTL
jgi:hypothetical protein